jgi:two-component system, cell cycle sensor histidine kinase and response regulator CckA
MDQARVVVVEDERIVALHLQQQLTKLGYQVVAVAASSDVALRHIRQKRPEVVLMDINIEGERDGIDTAASIPTDLDVPVIYLSAHSEPGTLDRAKATKPYGYLLKPFSERELHVTLQTVLERHRAEQALRRSEQRFRDIVRASSDSFWEVSPDLRYRQVWERDGDPSASALVGRPFLEDADRGFAPDALAQLFEDLRAHRPFRGFVYREAAATGLARYIRISGVPIEPQRGDFHGYRGAALDVTSEVAVEQQLRQAQKMESIGQLTGGLAHDFNNLLGIIIGNIDLLRERLGDDADADELAREALDAAARGADLTRRLLQFARRQPLQSRRMDANELLRETVKLLRRMLGDAIEVTLETAPGLWETVADPTQLQATIINLATNARDAMPQGGRLSISTANTALDRDYVDQNPGVVPGEYVVMTVADTGCGMAPDVRTRIFEPFFTTKGRDKGSGLGLSMVYGFIKQSDGHIGVYSEEGLGTSFKIYLPRAPGGADAIAAAAGQEPPERSGGRGETVLVVEDNPGMRRVAARQLRDLGYRVVEAENAAAALERLAAGPVALLFSDVLMPGGASGFDLARSAMARWPRLKVVLTSGFPDVTLREKMGIPAAIVLLGKPYRKDELATVIRKALDAGSEAG